MTTSETSQSTISWQEPSPTPKLPALLLLIAVSSLHLGCSETTISAPEPAVCTAATCPEGWCELTVNFSPDCTDLFGEAEILVAEALEPINAIVGTPFTSVSDIPKGTTVPVWIRAEGWQWEVELTCNNPERDGEFTLSCNSNTAP